MELLKNLECVAVEYTPDFKKATLTFFDEEKGQVREVSYNKQSYQDGKYVDDPKKEEAVQEMIRQDLGLTFDLLDEAQGCRADVYCYPKFNSLHPVSMVEKFTADQVGDIETTEIKEIFDDGTAIKIRYEIGGNTYESNMRYSKWLDKFQRYIADPIKKEKQYEKFKEKFLVPFEEKDSLIGHPIMVEVKTAFGRPFGEVKKFPKKK